VTPDPRLRSSNSIYELSSCVYFAIIGNLQHENEIAPGHRKNGKLPSRCPLTGEQVLSKTRFRSMCCVFVGKSCQMTNAVAQRLGVRMKTTPAAVEITK